MTPAEVKRHLLKGLKDNEKFTYDIACANIADIALKLKEAGVITSIVISTRSDDGRVTCVDVEFLDGDVLEVEIP